MHRQSFQIGRDLTNPTRRKSSNKESGQVIVLIALIVVVLLIFAGFAIDGGRLFLMQRDAQNAADAAAIEAGYALCTNGSIDSITRGAEDGALRGGFANDATYPDTVTVEYPRNGNNKLVGVYIRNRQSAYFLGLAGRPTLEVTVFASGECLTHPFADDRAAIIAFDWNRTAINALSITGSHNDVQGAAKSNSDFFNSASDSHFDSCEFIGDDNRGINTVCDNTVYPMDPITQDQLPVLDFEALCEEAGTACTRIVGNYFINPANCPTTFEGLLVVYGNVRINCSMIAPGFTILTTGSIDISSDVIARWDPYIPGLSAYTSVMTSDVVDGVKISVKQSNIGGPIIAPYTSCQVSAADSYLSGLMCNVVKISASNTVFRYDPDIELLLKRYVRIYE